MATINRFMRRIPKDFTLAYPDLQQFIPNQTAWLDTLNRQQQLYDAGQSMNTLIPEYAPFDEPYLNKYVSERQAKIDKLSEMYVNQDIIGGNRELRKLAAQQAQDFSPGGVASQFTKRAKTFQATKEAIAKQYADTPELIPYYQSQIGITPFKTEAGYGEITPPSMQAHYTPKDWRDQIDSVLDNIEASTVAISPGLIPSGVSLKYFLRSGKKEQLDYNKVANVLANSIPPEMLRSAEIYGLATGRGEGQGQIVTPDGKLNTQSAVGRLVDAAAKGKAYEKWDFDYQGVTDELAMEQAKSEMRKKEKEAEYKLDEVKLRTQIYNNVSGMLDWDDLGIEINKNGKVSENYEIPELSGTGLTVTGTETRKKESGLGFKDWIFSDEAPQSIKALANDYWKAISGMSDKQAESFLKEKYQIKKDKLSNTDAIITAYDSKQAEQVSEFFLGSAKGKDAATPGQLFSADITVTTTMPGKTQTMSGQEFAKMIGVVGSDGGYDQEALRHFVDNGKITSYVEAENAEMPSGHKLNYVDADGNFWNVTLGPRSLQEESLMQDVYDIHKLKREDNPNETIIRPKHPALQPYFPAGIRVEAADVYTVDLARANWVQAEKKKLQGLATEADVKQARTAYDQVSQNPYSNNFEFKEVRVLDPITNKPVPMVDDDGQPILNADGTIRFWTERDISNLYRNTVINK